jgi:hypothetical protein
MNGMNEGNCVSMPKLLTASLLCCFGLYCLAEPCQADDYVLINNIDAPNSANTNTAWAFGNLSVNGQVIGDDPGNTSGSVPTTAATSGYAVSPFTLGSTLQNGATTATVQEVQIAMSLQPPTGASAKTGNVYGSFFTPSTNNSLSSATQVGGWFEFNAATGETNGIGTGISERLTATPTAEPVLQAGKTYWLVMAPQAGLQASSSDSLTDYGLWLQNSSGAMARFGITNSTAYGTINSQLYEQEGAETGDTLTAGTAFFGTEVLAVAASVPETSTVITALLGLIPLGLLVGRMRSSINQHIA